MKKLMIRWELYSKLYVFQKGFSAFTDQDSIDTTAASVTCEIGEEMDTHEKVLDAFKKKQKTVTKTDFLCGILHILRVLEGNR